jgi:cation transporter-like permease
MQQRLEELRLVKRERHHPLVHEIHQQHKISRKTLFYVKEYGPHSHVARVIIRESVQILLLASIISSIGGFALEQIKVLFISLTPLVILLPALNDLIGDFGTIVSGHLSTLLHEEKIGAHWWKNHELRKLFVQVLLIGTFFAALGAGCSLFLAGFTHPAAPFEQAAAIFAIAIVDVVAVVSILFVVAVVAGIHFYKKGEDPNNFLIPITTSIADFGNMLLLAALVMMFF